MRSHIKKIFGVTIFILAITALFVWTLLWSTKAEVWYAGMHDAEHMNHLALVIAISDLFLQMDI